MAHLKKGVDVHLTAFQKKILPAITLPMPEDCPTDLRYALAKYDAAAIIDAWDKLRELATAELLEN